MSNLPVEGGAGMGAAPSCGPSEPVGCKAVRRDSSPCATSDGLAGLTMKRARKEVLAHIPDWLFRLLAPLGLAEKSRMYGTRAKARKGDVATPP